MLIDVESSSQNAFCTFIIRKHTLMCLSLSICKMLFLSSVVILEYTFSMLVSQQGEFSSSGPSTGMVYHTHYYGGMLF